MELTPEEKQKIADKFYWMGYNHNYLSWSATVDQQAEYNQGAEDRKWERDDGIN